MGTQLAEEDPELGVPLLLQLNQEVRLAWARAVAGWRLEGQRSNADIGRVLGVTGQAVGQRWPTENDALHRGSALTPLMWTVLGVLRHEAELGRGLLSSYEVARIATPKRATPRGLPVIGPLGALERRGMVAAAEVEGARRWAITDRGQRLLAAAERLDQEEGD
jgi:hypothetical protein